MKRNGMIATLVTLGAATLLYAGQGMGQGDCGNGQEPGYGQAMSAGKGMKGDGNGRMERQKMRRKHKGSIQKMMKTIRKELELTPEQRRKIREIMNDYRQAMKQQRQKRMQARKGQGKGRGIKGRGMEMDASRFMTARSFDKVAFKETMQRRWQMRERRRAERFRARLEMMADTMEKVFAVLTPEQRRKLIELSQKRMGGW